MARAYFPLIQPPLWGRSLLTKHVDLFTCVCCARPAPGEEQQTHQRPELSLLASPHEVHYHNHRNMGDRKASWLGSSQCVFIACNGHDLGKEGRGKSQDEVSGL